MNDFLQFILAWKFAFGKNERKEQNQMDIIQDTTLQLNTIIPLGTPFYVALRKNEDIITADFLTMGFTRIETELKMAIAERQLPEWCKEFPVVMVAKFRLADGFVNDEEE